MSGLKPCPFCGSDEVSHGYTDVGVFMGNCQCHTCNSCVLADTEAEAITAWNTRASDATIEAQAAEIARLREALIDASASLAAAVSLLERGGKAAKRAAPSDKMFDQMITDYTASLNRARAALKGADNDH